MAVLSIGYSSGGLVAADTYGMAICANSLMPLGMVSTIRESSVIIAPLIGMIYFGGRRGCYNPSSGYRCCFNGYIRPICLTHLLAPYMLWIALTILAAFMQAVRTAAQKKLANKLDATIVTWVRFAFGLPFALLLLAYLFDWSLPPITLSNRYLLLCLLVAVSQLIATLLLVLLLQRHNFAIGSTLVKSEAIFIAIIGLLFFAEHISPTGWLAIVLGILGLLIASMGKFHLNLSSLIGGIDSMSAKLGLTAGIGFAIASTCIRQANLSLTQVDSPIAQASITLTLVIAIQTVIGAAFVFSRKRNVVAEISSNMSICFFIGITSMLGSFGWFAAYALQNAAYVKTVGQIEFIFTILLTWFYFKEKIQNYEYIAILLVGISALLIIWGT